MTRPLPALCWAPAAGRHHCWPIVCCHARLLAKCIWACVSHLDWYGDRTVIVLYVNIWMLIICVLQLLSAVEQEYSINHIARLMLHLHLVAAFQHCSIEIHACFSRRPGQDISHSSRHNATFNTGIGPRVDIFRIERNVSKSFATLLSHSDRWCNGSSCFSSFNKVLFSQLIGA